MKRTVISLICPIIIGLFFTSCLRDTEETVLSSTVAITSFSINDLKAQHTEVLDNGKDTTYTIILKTSLTPFTIDQERGLVYNSDSIAYGADVTRVLASISADGHMYYHKEEEKIVYSKGDSIDFTHPVKFTVVSNDGNYSRDYLISINVHKVDPTKTEWKLLEGANFPIGLFCEQKAIIRDQRIYVLGHDENGRYYTTYTGTDDGMAWNEPEQWIGIEEGADCSSIILFDGMFHMLVGNTLYRSSDGITWERTAANSIDHLLAATSEESPTAWGIIEGKFAYSSDMLAWTTLEQVAGMSRSIAYTSEPLHTNPYINRTIVIGLSDVATDTCAKVWSKLSTETEWAEVKPAQNNPYGCPNLENLAVINYHDRMYAFGGKSVGQRKKPLEAFGASYESRDNGVTWRVRDEAFKLSENFVGRDENFSTVIDYKNRVWIIWSRSGEVWRASWTPTM